MYNTNFNSSSYQIFYKPDEEMVAQEEIQEAKKNSVCPGIPLVLEKITLDDPENKCDVKEENILGDQKRERKRVFAVIQENVSEEPSSSKKRKVQEKTTIKILSTSTFSVSEKSEKKFQKPTQSSFTTTTTTVTSFSVEADSEEQDSSAEASNSSSSSDQVEIPSSSSARGPLKKRPEMNYLPTYQAFMSTSKSLNSPVSFDENAACLLPIPFQKQSWLEVVKLAHSIMEAEKKDLRQAECALRGVMHAMKSLSKEDIRSGALATLKQAAQKGRKALDFYLSLEKLSQYKDSVPSESFDKRYRLEFYEFSKQKYSLCAAGGNMEADITIRLYRKDKGDKTYHYDLLIMKD